LDERDRSLVEHAWSWHSEPNHSIIAQRFQGDGTRWTSLYEANKINKAQFTHDGTVHVTLAFRIV
jgi:hypothetical protein